MKKVISISILTALTIGVSLLVITMLFYKANAQTTQKEATGTKPIPESVMKIAKAACVDCHAEPGNMMAKSHVNLSNWDKYSPEKQAAKAKDMCEMVTKGKMPPKKFKESHPEAVPTAENIKTLCDWAESLQMPKK
jgi:hypothetical protein